MPGTFVQDVSREAIGELTSIAKATSFPTNSD